MKNIYTYDRRYERDYTGKRPIYIKSKEPSIISEYIKGTIILGSIFVIMFLFYAGFAP